MAGVAVRIGTASSYTFHPVNQVEQNDLNILLSKHLADIGGSLQSSSYTCKVGNEPELVAGVNFPMDTLVRDVLPFGRYVQFKRQDKACTSKSNNIFSQMMDAARARKLPKPVVNPKTRKDELYNALLNMLEGQGLGWSGFGVDGRKFVESMRDILWRIDPHREKRHISMPKLMADLVNFNVPANHGHKAPPLTLKLVQSAVETLAMYLEKPWMKTASWSPMHDALVELMGKLDNLAKVMQRDC